MKAVLVRTAVAATGIYFRHLPYLPGNRWIHNHIVERNLGWRDIDVSVRTKFGSKMRVNVHDAIGRKICYFGVWEPAITQYIADRLSSNDVFIDVGANIGYYSLLAARLVGPNGHVFAVEASPTICRTLQYNVASNACTNITIKNLAVTDRPGPVPIYLHDHENTGHTTIIDSLKNGDHHTLEGMVEGLPLQRIVPTALLRKARLIKIDVEGAEWLVLQGLKDELPHLSPDVELLVEINSDAVRSSGGSVEEFLSILRFYKFSPFSIKNNYSNDEYLNRPDGSLRPLADLAFAQADIVFRKVA